MSQAASEWPQLQEAAASLCVAWWQADAPRKEAVVAHTVPYLLVRALSTSKLKTHGPPVLPSVASVQQQKAGVLMFRALVRIPEAVSNQESKHSFLARADKAADVKRCYAMRKGLELLDFEDGSIVDLKRLLLRAAFSPAFLRSKEGRRYLAFLFVLDVSSLRPCAAYSLQMCCRT
jgi:hypothetical protein